MQSNHDPEAITLDTLRGHLAVALEETDDDDAKYHIREAYQKAIVLKDEKQRRRRYR